MTLEQATAFRPFPGIFVSFAQIAFRTSNNQVVNTISRSITGYGKRMVNMVFTPCNFLIAVVTFAFLPIILLSNLLWRVIAREVLFAGIAVTHIGVMFFQVSQSVYIHGSSALFFISFIVTLVFLIEKFRMKRVTFSISFSVLYSILSIFYSSFCKFIGVRSFFPTAFLASRVQPVTMLAFALMKIVSGFREYVQALRTLLFILVTRLLDFTKCGSVASAFFTFGGQSISSIACFVEVGGSSRKKVLALTALLTQGIVLRYNITHDRSYLSVIGLGCYEHCQPLQSFLNYSIKPLYRQVCEVNTHA